ncbi:MAG TPA: hypothetical protein VN700_11675 [Vicinamibacterales bacterium]|nr:hypothetical protein [Vicinamibacterales bacterium]
MSDERFVAIEQRLDSVDRSINNLSNRVGHVEVNLTSRMDRLESELGGRMDRLEGELGERIDCLDRQLGGRMDRLEGDLGGLGGQIERLATHMHVLHEDLVDRIKALAPDFQPLRREFMRADDKLRDELDIRLVPLEADLRLRSKKRRGTS